MASPDNQDELQEAMARRASRRRERVSPTTSGKPVKMLARGSDRQQVAIGEFLNLLPIIEAVANIPPYEHLQTEEEKDEAVNARLTELMRARKIVTDRICKEL